MILEGLSKDCSRMGWVVVTKTTEEQGRGEIALSEGESLSLMHTHTLHNLACLYVRTLIDTHSHTVSERFHLF